LIAIVEFSDFACPACATHALTEDAPTSLPPIIDTKGNHHVYYFNH
jgi:protein-disulfide isomerase